MTKKKELAKDARTIAAQMRFFAKPGAKFSTQSPPITFIPFALGSMKWLRPWTRNRSPYAKDQ
jgi:hypothetical protein